MRTNLVLIDFESVQPESLTALDQDHFKVKLFVGANQTKVPFELATAVHRMGERAEYIKIAGNGHNALDFHIAFYIGQWAAQDSSAYFHIISKDTGFDPLIEHLKSKKISAARSASIEEIPILKAENNKSPDERAQLFIASLKQPKATRPRTEKRLSSAVAAFHQNKLTEQEVAEVVAAIQSTGFLKVVDSKISYFDRELIASLPTANP